MSDDREVTEIRIGVIGSVDSGKSTLTGVLTTNELDNGRGSARSKILKHPHEKQSGRTSSVAQHYIRTIVETEENAECEGESEVKGTEEKVISFVDLAGHEKYLKTTIGGIKRCLVDYSSIVVGANMGVLRMTKEHLSVATALNIPFFIIVTKIDIAPSNVKENTIKSIKKLATVLPKKLTGLKKIPIDIETEEDLELVYTYYKNGQHKVPVPIFQVSSVTGEGLSILKKFINNLQSMVDYKKLYQEDASFIIDSKYMIKGVGLVVSGIVSKGILRKGDVLELGPYGNKFYKVMIRSIHNNFRENISILKAGQSGCFNIKLVNHKDNIKRNSIKNGMQLCWQPKFYSKFDAKIKILHHPTNIKLNYRPTIHCGGISQCAKIWKMDKDYLRSLDISNVSFEFIYHPEFIEPNTILVFREGKTMGFGKIINVY